MLFGYSFEPSDIGLFFTLLLLEGVLSFDNAAILAVMVRRLPMGERHKALLYGLGGGYLLRALAILAVRFLISNPIPRLIAGGYLLYLAGRYFFGPSVKEARTPKAQKLTFFRAFWGVVIAVELADLAFALDQVVVAVALTDKVLIIVAASFVGILFLRLVAAFITRVLEWYPPMEGLAYIAVAFVGLKLVAIEAMHALGHPEFDVPRNVSAAITATLLVVPPVVKFIVDWLTGARASPEKLNR
ncbi:MAG: TerC family protein [Thermoplasmatota archaeon]